MNSNEDSNIMSNMDGQMMPKLTQMKTWIPVSNMDGQMMPKWTQMKTWIPWAIWMDKWCQNELKWRLDSHGQYGWTNDAKMNTNDDFNIMSNMDGQIEYHEQYGWTNDAKMNSNEDLNPMKQYGWTNDAKMNSNEDSNPVSNMDGQMMPKLTKMKIWIPWAIRMDKWCQNELKWRLESREQYGWTNDAKMNSNELK